MTQLQLDSAVAQATGESLRLVRGHGFSLLDPRRADLEPEDLVLAVVCPFCRRSTPYPGFTRDGELPLAECLGCDVYFPIAPGEIFPAPIAPIPA